MGNSALFAGIPPAQCREIVAAARPRVFATDEILFMQGHPVRTHVLIQSGNVKVTQVSATGSEVLLWMNGPGESVRIPNEAASRRHACSARAMQRCHALTWEDSRFQSIINRYPQIGININRMLALQLAELEQRFREIATEKVATRLSFALVRLAAQIGKPILGGIEVSLSRLELAQMIGTTLFTVSRILSKWGEEGFIAPRRDAVIVYDNGRLLLAGVDTE
jgi:CRP-like cAMP-binding protein